MYTYLARITKDITGQITLTVLNEAQVIEVSESTMAEHYIEIVVAEDLYPEDSVD